MKFIYLGILSMIIVSCVATQGNTKKEKLTNYFGDLIKLQDPEKRDFYEKYWRTIDPKRWEKGKR